MWYLGNVVSVFFLNDTATTEIYTLSLHDALPIFDRDAVEAERSHLRPQVPREGVGTVDLVGPRRDRILREVAHGLADGRSEEHTSELQSRQYLVCRLLLETKKTSSCLSSSCVTSL